MALPPLTGAVHASVICESLGVAVKLTGAAGAEAGVAAAEAAPPAPAALMAET
jgi:hypothetical protein